MAIYFAISLDDVVFVMKSLVQTICTEVIMGSHPHPRTYDSFPKGTGKTCQRIKAKKFRRDYSKDDLRTS